MKSHHLIIRHLGTQDYEPVWHAMRDYTAKRESDAPDELWLLQHPPVYTQGLNGKAEHILDAGDIPVVQSDRGGQVTYHGPGQLIAYPLLDLKHHHLNISQLVSQLEHIVITLLGEYGISARGDSEARGVYVDKAKICSIGLRIKRGYSYHGLALNVDMDLAPYTRINPCGFRALPITHMRDLADFEDISEISTNLVKYFCQKWGYENTYNIQGLMNEHCVSSTA